jgi:integrase
MKRAETASKKQEIKQRQSHGQTFAKVKDGRKQDIRGLWVRNGRYYARLNVENPITGEKKTRWVGLVDKENQPVETVPQAIAELNRLRTHRADNMLRNLARTPKLSNYVTTYLENIAAGEGAKAPATVKKEGTILGRWVEAIGQLRLDQIKRVHVNHFIVNRQKEEDAQGNPKVCNRTINLDVIGLRCVMKQAMADGHIQRLPMEGLKPLPESESKRPLFTASELEKLCVCAFETKKDKEGKTVPLTENAQELVDYIKLMAYSGCRRNEALGILWDDVDSENAQLHVRRQITTRGTETLKNGEERTVDFNAKLRAHLEDMDSRRAPDCQWLFPSPQRGEKDIPAKSFRESLDMVKERAKLPGFGFHDLRHHFISMCVMSGIDFMTIASWVGHKDGGILIGKVYGHLANEHRKAMAERVNFGPAILSQAKSA